MNVSATTPKASPGLSRHRLEALVDGIFAVAMTLLVIELKLPEPGAIHSQPELINAVGHLLPKFIAWVISFFVLAMFWFGNHRLFQYVHNVDGRLIALNLMLLGFVSLMPFSSAMAGEYTPLLFSQIFYSWNMTMLAICALLTARYVFRHPELCGPTPMPLGAYKGARFRTLGLIVISAVAIVIAMLVPTAGNAAFMLMIVLMRVGRRIEAAANAPPTADQSNLPGTPST